jgi:hypothetical protein
MKEKSTSSLSPRESKSLPISIKQDNFNKTIPYSSKAMQLMESGIKNTEDQKKESEEEEEEETINSESDNDNSDSNLLFEFDDETVDLTGNKTDNTEI